MNQDSIIYFENVSKWFGDFQVLNKINLEVNKGEKIVVCGPSGSGKSTMIRCINRLEEHQEGKIIVDGTELTGNVKNIDTVRREVGMVFQQFNLFPHLSILDNLTTQHKIENTQIKAWLKTSDIQKNWLYRKFTSLDLDKQQDPKIAILGLTYKENTNSIRNSSAIDFLNQVQGYKVWVHDPVVKLINMPWLQQVEDATEAIANADVLIVATPWPEYQHLKLEKLYSIMKRPIIIDPLSLFLKQNPEQYGFKWIRLGV